MEYPRKDGYGKLSDEEVLRRRQASFRDLPSDIIYKVNAWIGTWLTTVKYGPYTNTSSIKHLMSSTSSPRGIGLYLTSRQMAEALIARSFKPKHNPYRDDVYLFYVYIRKSPRKQ